MCPIANFPTLCRVTDLYAVLVTCERGRPGASFSKSIELLITWRQKSSWNEGFLALTAIYIAHV